MFSTTPRMGMFIIWAIFTALPTIMLTSSWGLVTTTMPSTGRVWNTVRGTSPVPGGMSTNRKSTSFQMTSCQNCFTAPAMTGPRHTTGSSSFSSRRFTLITSMPVRLWMGQMPFSSPSARPWMPNSLGMEGPVMSASSTPTR